MTRFAAQASERQEDPIDVEVQKRLDSGRNMAGALNWGEDAWDKALNVAYQKLMKTLPKRQQALLKESQMGWIRHRDYEFKLMIDIFENSPGKIMGSSAYGPRLNLFRDRLEIVKERALRLRHYLATPYAHDF